MYAAWTGTSQVVVSEAAARAQTPMTGLDSLLCTSDGGGGDGSTFVGGFERGYQRSPSVAEETKLSNLLFPHTDPHFLAGLARFMWPHSSDSNGQ